MTDSFTNAIVTSASSAMIEAESQRATAEIQAEYVIAKRFPRDERQAIDKIMLACQREKLAETAIYSYARGGTAISGPSIRLAEAVAQSWGNIKFGVRELDQRDGISTVQAFAKDLETGTSREMVFQVAHKRFTRQGSKELSDPRDVYELIANNGSRRVRACILAIIPGDVVEAAVEQCQKTLEIKSAVTPDSIAKMLEKFAEYNVTKAQIEKRIQRRIKALTPAQLVNLRTIFNSLKDGMSSAEEWFEKEPEKPAEPKFQQKEETPKPRAKKQDQVDLVGIIKAEIEKHGITLEDVFDYVEDASGDRYDSIEKMDHQLKEGLAQDVKNIPAWIKQREEATK